MCLRAQRIIEEKESPTMSKSDYGGTAKIYQFPVKVRTMASRHREEPNPAADLATSRFTKVAVGSGWYHDAAIQEAERARQN
jgi:hypothetical protein